MESKMMRRTVALVVGMMVAAGVACGPMDHETAVTAGSAEALTVALRRPSSGKMANPRLPSAAGRRLPEVAVTPTVKPPPATPNQCATAGEPGALVQVSSVPSVGLPTRTEVRHIIADTPRLYLAATLRNVCGAHVGAFDVYTPTGAFYTRLSMPFSTSGQNLAVTLSGYVVQLEMPVAGTEIEAHAMAGTWSINYVQDGNDLALGLGEFELVAQ